MDEPSNDWPFSNMLSMFFDATARFFIIPFMSVNWSLTNFMSFSCISWMTFVTFFFQTASLKFFNFSSFLVKFSCLIVLCVMAMTCHVNIFKLIAIFIK
jgi:hypothetical protein